MTKKEIIIKRFLQNVYGKKANIGTSNAKHSGSKGHWLEKQMGVSHNRNTAPDLYGYEMKNHTSLKTTFGDWSADYYLFKDNNYNISRNEFITYFGKPNPKKENRPSWSGEPIPTITTPSTYNGSRMLVDDLNEVIKITYDYSNDPRPNKNLIIPLELRDHEITLASWEYASLKKKLIDKFGQAGWFRCRTNKEGLYVAIEFGEPMTFENWLKGVRSGLIFFDSGMYLGNSRNYSQWRANNAYWDSLITEKYPNDQPYL